MRHPLSVGLMMLAVWVAAGEQADAGFFDRLAETFGGGSRVVQSDEPTLAQPAPLVVPAAQTEEAEPSAPSDDVEPPLAPVPDEAGAELESIELYPCIHYDDKDEMHPCAVPVVVSVPDPASVKHPFYWLVGDAPASYCGCGTCTACCGKPQVYVMICVPPDCPVPAPRVTHNDRKYTYDFGRYSVDVKLQRGAIEVEYDND